MLNPLDENTPYVRGLFYTETSFAFQLFYLIIIRRKTNNPKDNNTY